MSTPTISTVAKQVTKVQDKIEGLKDEIKYEVKQDLMYQRLEEQFRGKGFLEKLEGIIKIIQA